MFKSFPIYRSTSPRPICNEPVLWMDPDYIADLVEENRVLQSRLAEMDERWHGQVAELEDELRQAREDLKNAFHRKVEEVSTSSFPPLWAWM